MELKQEQFVLNKVSKEYENKLFEFPKHNYKKRKQHALGATKDVCSNRWIFDDYFKYT